MSLGSTIANAIYNALFKQTNWTAPTAIWLSLHTADPGETGASEVGDATYARVNVTAAFGSPTAGDGSNTSAIEQAAGATTGFTATHYGLWSAATAGTFYHGGDISPDKVVGAGEILRFPIGDLDITVT